MADRNKSSTCHWGKLLLWGLMEPISLHLHALSQSHCVFFISKNRLIYCFRLPNCRQLFPVLSCFYSCGYATHCTVVFREIYPPTNFNFRFHLMIACLIKTVDVFKQSPANLASFKETLSRGTQREYS